MQNTMMGPSASCPTTDPITPRLLPAFSPPPPRSADSPSFGAIRPFGLTRTTILDSANAPASAGGMTYDPKRQINVHPGGEVPSGHELMITAVTNQNTQADHQHWTDKD